MSSESMSNRSLGEQLQAFYNCILVSPDEAAQRQLAVDRITELVREVLPLASVHLVGSTASGLASKNSSVDLSVEVDGDDAATATEEGDTSAAGRDRDRAERVLAALRRREGEFLRVQAMHSRLVSLVTCVYRQADLRCSVRLGSGGRHRRAAAFLGGVAALSEAFQLLTVVTREWALSRQLIRRKGALTGYTVALLVLFHLEQGGLVPPEVVRALARGHRKSEVSEALRKWHPEPLSVEQLGEQFCGLVRLYATLGFFASGAPCVLTGRLLDRGLEDPFPGSRVSLPCPVSGENAGRTYTRASEPEEPFFRTALNLAKDHDLFTACFTRNLDGMRKAKLVQQLPAFRRLEEQNLVPPMQRLVERVQRTLETRGRSGYEKFAGRLTGARQHQQQYTQQQQQHQQQYQPHRQRPQSASAPIARASSSPKRPVSAHPRRIPRPRPVLLVPRSGGGGGGSGGAVGRPAQPQQKQQLRQASPKLQAGADADRQSKSVEKAALPPRRPATAADAGGAKPGARGGAKSSLKSKSSAPRSKSETQSKPAPPRTAKLRTPVVGKAESDAKETPSFRPVEVEVDSTSKSGSDEKSTSKSGGEAKLSPESVSIGESALNSVADAGVRPSPQRSVSAESPASKLTAPPPGVKSTWADAAKSSPKSQPQPHPAKSVSAAALEERRPLGVNNRPLPPPPPSPAQQTQSLPQPLQIPRRVSYASVVANGKRA